jgi:hypothetical protein
MKTASCLSIILMFVLMGSVQRTSGQGGNTSVQKPSLLSGRVFDRNGSVVVGAEVWLAGNRGTTFGTITNDEGSYRVELPADFYSIKIHAEGFLTFRFDDYQIPMKGRVTLDATLQVKGETDCVSVDEEGTSNPCPRPKKRKTIIIE